MTTNKKVADKKAVEVGPEEELAQLKSFVQNSGVPLTLTISIGLNGKVGVISNAQTIDHLKLLIQAMQGQTNRFYEQIIELNKQ